MSKTRFGWDTKKDQENQDKHGVAFGVAQFAFADPKRVIAEDFSHSSNEKRHFLLRPGGKRSPYCQIRVSRRCDPYFRGRLLAQRKANL